MRFETRAIHDGQEAELTTGAVTVPVYQTSTYQQDGIGKPRGYEYSRTGNPTRQALEQALASLEGGRYGLAFASGVAATTAVFQLLRPGDQVVAGDDLYGGTYRLLERVYRPWGLHVDYADVTDPAAFAASIKPNTRMIWIETPTNPLLKIADIASLATIARKSKALLVVDSTFASPYFQRPLELGAHIVVHSTTKYLGGHSDTIGGVVVLSEEEAYQQTKFYQNAAGAVPGPWDCWLILRGIKTLAVRMREHERNALHLARLLEKHPKVERVYYPGLESHPQHKLAQRQMSGFSGMISFEIAGGYPAVEQFVSRLKLFLLAESLGGVESLVCYPPKMTHSALDPAERKRRGIRDNLIRLSVGIEHIADLEADLLGALGE
ncbi:MAG: cystathionine gamma-synthase [Verrucomicrobia bacterium]|nr:cystathionine gamma-synthase [Verrucomicrobiota bacterium]MBU4290046.1 cystathionine gamma-synthase [Verrucomicrobiota bacterium]MBU4428085.1 cystathionine gamma-synthase [Verrucomicrobiota bacterium]MCG2679584.1 cystathionine gamma-synthase [Kiritimatiellia bacterium]